MIAQDVQFQPLPDREASKFQTGKKAVFLLLSRSAHRTPNFTNPEFEFPQLKVLQIIFFFFIKRVILAFFGIF